MIYWQLLGVFFTIGLFCFGGGYAIIPFIEDAITARGWITTDEFINMIAVAESTPGPISINTATFVGFRLEGLLGAFTATLGLCLPAFVLVVFVGKILATKRGKAFIDRIMIGIRPMVVAMIFAAALSIAQTVLVTESPTGAKVDFFAVILALAAFVGIRKFAIHPVVLIALAAIVGIIRPFF